MTGVDCWTVAYPWGSPPALGEERRAIKVWIVAPKFESGYVIIFLGFSTYAERDVSRGYQMATMDRIILDLRTNGPASIS
jgi:hypothetical protein